ncbi:MAG: GIY-YIG nuclease family protein [Patescibacteria group bacterium]|jgi:predicted GIY-YIG superfamily endonuclease
MPTWTVYILRCSDGSLYTGITTNLEARLAKHNDGTGAKYTRSKRPVHLVWSERKRNEGNARKREAALKKLTKREKETLVIKKLRSKSERGQP